MVQVGGAEPRPLGVAELSSGPTAASLPLLGAIVRNLEAEQERWFLWLPAMFGAGIALYFLLPAEPGMLAATLPAVAALALHLALGHGGVGRLATAALLATALGMAAGKLRTEDMRDPVLERQMGPIDVYGFVELVEPRPSKGQRLTIRVTALETCWSTIRASTNAPIEARATSVGTCSVAVSGATALAQAFSVAWVSSTA